MVPVVPVIGVIPNDASLRGFASSVEGMADGCRSQLDLSALVEVGVRLRLDVLIRQGFLEIIRYSSIFAYFSDSFLSSSYLKILYCST